LAANATGDREVGIEPHDFAEGDCPDEGPLVFMMIVHDWNDEHCREILEELLCCAARGWRAADQRESAEQRSIGKQIRGADVYGHDPCL
jgi:hypothetical protein